MGNKLAKKRSQVEEQYTQPQGLYEHRDIDLRRLRNFIVDGKLSPCYQGVEDSDGCDLEECPICFLCYPSLNRSRCCGKGICTECFLQVRPPPPFRTMPCPFCKGAAFAVEYRGEKSAQEKSEEQAEEQKVVEARIRMLAEEREADAVRQARMAENPAYQQELQQTMLQQQLTLAGHPVSSSDPQAASSDGGPSPTGDAGPSGTPGGPRALTPGGSSGRPGLTAMFSRTNSMSAARRSAAARVHVPPRSLSVLTRAARGSSGQLAAVGRKEGGSFWRGGAAGVQLSQLLLPARALVGAGGGAGAASGNAGAAQDAAAVFGEALVGVVQQQQQQPPLSLMATAAESTVRPREASGSAMPGAVSLEELFDLPLLLADDEAGMRRAAPYARLGLSPEYLASSQHAQLWGVRARGSPGGGPAAGHGSASSSGATPTNGGAAETNDGSSTSPSAGYPASRFALLAPRGRAQPGVALRPGSLPPQAPAADGLVVGSSAAGSPGPDFVQQPPPTLLYRHHHQHVHQHIHEHHHRSDPPHSGGYWAPGGGTAGLLEAALRAPASGGWGGAGGASEGSPSRQTAPRGSHPEAALSPLDSAYAETEAAVASVAEVAAGMVSSRQLSGGGFLGAGRGNSLPSGGGDGALSPALLLQSPERAGISLDDILLMEAIYLSLQDQGSASTVTAASSSAALQSTGRGAATGAEAAVTAEGGALSLGPAGAAPCLLSVEAGGLSRGYEGGALASGMLSMADGVEASTTALAPYSTDTTSTASEPAGGAFGSGIDIPNEFEEQMRLALMLSLAEANEVSAAAAPPGAAASVPTPTDPATPTVASRDPAHLPATFTNFPAASSPRCRLPPRDDSG